MAGSITIPRAKPIVENLNSYYLDVSRFIEHYQGEVGSGCLFMQSHGAEGAIFFDKDDLLNGIFKNREEKLLGAEAIGRLLGSSGDHNYSIRLYQIDSEIVYFWAGIPDAIEVYRDLSTEFTDLEGLLTKIIKENFTGYIEISLPDGDEGGHIFLANGEIIGCSYLLEKEATEGAKNTAGPLIRKTVESGGLFHVYKMEPKEGSVENDGDLKEESASPDVLLMVQELLVQVESVVQSNKRIKTEFKTLLKRKFIDVADQFPFLDPFAAEFDYADQQVSFSGSAARGELLRGVMASVKALASDLGMLSRLQDELTPWSTKYSEKLSDVGINL